jgi:hypothetical protein
MDDAQGFEQTYPTLSRWAAERGWLEVGRTEWSRSRIRVLDDGGLVWEGGVEAMSLSTAFAEAEQGLRAWLAEQGDEG